MEFIYEDEQLAVDVIGAIHTGVVLELKRMLAENPGLVKTRIIGRDFEETGISRTLLHVAADWPGHFPNGAMTVGALVEAGADVDAKFTGPHTETPLHWAASSDDTETLDSLLDAGADIEAKGGVIGDGTPLDDAVAFGQWNAARRLVECGAQTKLWTASGLGLMEQVKEYFTKSMVPSPFEITQAFWLACHGGQLTAATYLYDQGVDLNWIGYDELTPLDAALRSNANDLVEWLRGKEAKSVSEL
ncbi:MAG: ankyrin repeat domain-containing protein [Bacillota bacterium]